MKSRADARHTQAKGPGLALPGRGAPGSAQMAELQALADTSPAVTRLATLRRAPVQRTLDRVTPAVWANATDAQAKVNEKLHAFAMRAHEDDNLYTRSELDGFYGENLKGKAHFEFDETNALYDQFRRWVAMTRDGDGAHGAERHGGTGDEFIVDRANASRRAMTASYLEMDAWLQWDTILHLNASEIFAAYAKLASDTLGELRDALAYGDPMTGNPVTLDRLAAINVRRAVFDTPGGENFHKRRRLKGLVYGKGAWEADLVTYIMGRAPNPEGENYSLRVGASITGVDTLPARTVTGGGGNYVSPHEVTDIDKRPEAHTGGLSPQFVVDSEGGIVSAPDTSSLAWVTKF